MIQTDESSVSAVENLIASVSNPTLISQIPANSSNTFPDRHQGFLVNENHTNLSLKRPLSNPALGVECRKITRPSSAIGIVEQSNYPTPIPFKTIDEENESPNSKENYLESSIEPHKEVHQIKQSKGNCLGQIINSLLGQEEQIVRLEGANYLENVQRYAAKLRPMDCCFVVEKCRPFNCDTVFMSYFREQYLSPILSHLNGGPPLHADFGRDAYTSIYSMLNFSAVNCQSGCKTMVPDTPSIYRILKESTQMHFTERHFQTPSPKNPSPGKRAASNTNGTTGGKFPILPILEGVEKEFLRLHSLREGLASSVVRHCFFLLCSPISFEGIDKIKKANDIIDRLNRLDVKLTIFSPIKDTSYSVLYEMVNRASIDPIYDKTWKTIYLSAPLMSIHLNDASSSIIGPVASAHHAEEQAKLAMRSTFEVQHQQKSSPAFSPGMGPRSSGSHDPHNPSATNVSSPMFSSQPNSLQQVQQQHSSPSNARNPGSASACYNFLSGPQSVPSSGNNTVNGNYSNNQQNSAQSPYQNSNHIPHSPYAQGGGQPKSNQGAPPFHPQQQQIPYSNRSTTPNASQALVNNNYPPQQPLAHPMKMQQYQGQPNGHSDSMNSGPPSVGTPNNVGGRKSLQDPGSVHSNSGNDNPQSWGRPCTPNNPGSINNPPSNHRSNTPVQNMNLSGISNPGPSPMQVSSVPSPSVGYGSNQPTPNQAYIPHSPSTQQFVSHQQQQNGHPPQHSQMDPKMFKNNSQTQQNMQRQGTSDSLGMLISSGPNPGPPSMPPISTSLNSAFPGQQPPLQNNPQLHPHQQRPPPQAPMYPGGGGGQGFPRNPVVSSQPSSIPSSVYSSQANQMTAKQSMGLMSNANSMEDINRYDNQMNFQQNMNQPPSSQHQQQQLINQQFSRQQNKQDMIRMNQKMTHQQQKQLISQQQQQQVPLGGPNDPNLLFPGGPGGGGGLPNPQMKQPPRPNFMPGNTQMQPQQANNPAAMQQMQMMRNQRVVNPNMNIGPNNKPMDNFDMNMLPTNSGGPTGMPNFPNPSQGNLQFNQMMTPQQKYQLQNIMHPAPNNQSVGAPMDSFGLPQQQQSNYPNDDRQKFPPQMLRQMAPQQQSQQLAQRMPMKMSVQQQQQGGGPPASSNYNNLHNHPGFMNNNNNTNGGQPQQLLQQQSFHHQQQRPRF